MWLLFSVDRLLSPAYRQVTPLEDQLKELLEKLDLSTAMKHSPSRSKRLKLLKKSIMEVRSELSLKKAFLPRPPAPPTPEAQPLTKALPQPLAPPMLELLTSLAQIDVPSESPTAPSPDVDAHTSTSALTDAPGGRAPASPLLNGELYAEASATCSQRTSALFRKSKSTSPHKAPGSQEAGAAPPPPQPLGAKTFLSVVIPRLETLLLPRKRRRSMDGEQQEEEPVKRLGTGSACAALLLGGLVPNGSFLFSPGVASGLTLEEELSAAPRLLEPRRRCASESSISSGGGLLPNTR